MQNRVILLKATKKKFSKIENVRNLKSQFYIFAVNSKTRRGMGCQDTQKILNVINEEKKFRILSAKKITIITISIEKKK